MQPTLDILIYTIRVGTGQGASVVTGSDGRHYVYVTTEGGERIYVVTDGNGTPADPPEFRVIGPGPNHTVGGQRHPTGTGNWSDQPGQGGPVTGTGTGPAGMSLVTPTTPGFRTEWATDGWRRYVDSTGRIWRALQASQQSGAMVIMSEFVLGHNVSFNNRNTHFMNHFFNGTGSFSAADFYRWGPRLAPELRANARPFTHADGLNDTISTPGIGFTTTNPLFVLSYAEINRWGMDTNARRIARGTDNELMQWHTRSHWTGTDARFNAMIATSGARGIIGISDVNQTLGFRPAMWVNTILPDRTSWNVSGSGGNQSVRVTAGVNWTATSSHAWVTTSPASGSGNGNFTMTAQPNPNNFARTAVVTVGGTHIFITQEASGGGLGTGPAGMAPAVFSTPGYRVEWGADNWLRWVDSTGRIWREFEPSRQNDAVAIMLEHVISTNVSFNNRNANVMLPFLNGTFNFANPYPWGQRLAPELRTNARAFNHADDANNSISRPHSFHAMDSVLFTLSEAELTAWGLSTAESRIARNEAGTIMRWHLRSSQEVTVSGAFAAIAATTTNAGLGFRPAMWVNVTAQ